MLCPDRYFSQPETPHRAFVPAVVVGLSSVHVVASDDGKTRKGDSIAYKADVSNVGNTCLTDVQVTEQVLAGGLGCGTGTTCFRV